MTSNAIPRPRSLKSRLIGLVAMLGKALCNFVSFLVILWGSLALFYSNLPWSTGRAILAIAFFGFGIYALWIAGRKFSGTRSRNSWRRAFVVAFLVVMAWHISIPPSNDRPWRTEVMNPPRAVIDGDKVRFTNYRNFIYRSRDDFDVRYEDRVVDISRIDSMDLIVSYWKVGPVAHTMMSFNFDDGSPPVCISIESRPEVGESFDPIASLFKQFELVYVVGDERDIIRVRTDHRDEEVFLYRLRARPEMVRDLFRLYLERINSLADKPEWYHLLSNSCTINVIRYSRAVGGRHQKFELKHLLNGLIDSYLYRLGVLNNHLGFEELRRRAHINRAAQEAGDAEDFSMRVREDVPGVDDTE